MAVHSKVSKALKWLFFVWIFVHHWVGAKSIIEESAASALQRADAAYDVTIIRSVSVSSDGIDCGWKYYSAIAKVVKGKSETKSLLFGFVGGLEPGGRYRIYVWYPDNKERLYKYILDIVREENMADLMINGCVMDEQYFFRAERRR